MLLALVLTVQAATATPSPCTDQMSMLCRISPFFCPSAYPSDLAPGSANVPCWPERQPVSVSRDTRVVHRPASVRGPQSVSNPQGAAATTEEWKGHPRSIVRVPEPR